MCGRQADAITTSPLISSLPNTLSLPVSTLVVEMNSLMASRERTLSKRISCVHHLAQRIVVERIGQIRREHPRHGVEPQIAWRAVDRPVAEQHVPGRALHRTEAALAGDRSPEFRKPLARPFGAAANPAVGQRDRVHRAGAGAGDRRQLKPPVLQQPIQHAPGEGAVRAAALQRDVDAFSLLRLAVRGHGVSFVRWVSEQEQEDTAPFPALADSSFIVHRR